MVRESKSRGFCFLNSQEGYRCVCLLGGEAFCVQPNDPQSCGYRMLDEEIVTSPDGQSSLKIVVQISPPECHFYLQTLDGKRINSEPILSRTELKTRIDSLFEDNLQIVNRILRKVEKD